MRWIMPALLAFALPAAGLAQSQEGGLVRVLIAADLETTLAAQMAGRIVEFDLRLGQTVEKGRLLVGFDCAESMARAAMADADFVTADENLDAKRRLRRLDAAGDVEVRLAQAAADRAKGQVDLARTQLAYCRIEAPFSGRIARLHVKPHQSVNAGVPLIDLVGTETLKLRLNVSSRWLRWIRTGFGFEFNVDETGRAYRARVTAVNARVDASAQIVEIEGQVEGNHPELMPGMSGTARFRTER